MHACISISLDAAALAYVTYDEAGKLRDRTQVAGLHDARQAKLERAPLREHFEAYAAAARFRRRRDGASEMVDVATPRLT
ncbi:MAG: hypothetical protein AAF830_17645 [Pseudomonadota bacterium]